MASRCTVMLALVLSGCPAGADAPPSLELLEFLAEWQDAGELVDPFALPEVDDEKPVPGESGNGDK